MVVTNIELYEALKRDLNEDAARMIAEVVPPASDVATKGDVAALRTEIADVKSCIDSRLHRMTLAFLVPMWTTTLGVVAALVTLDLKL